MDPGHFHEVDADAQDHQTAGRGHGVQNGRFLKEMEVRGEQGDGARIDPCSRQGISFLL